MTAPIDLESRFNTSTNPADFLQLLMQMSGNGAAPAEAPSAAADAGDDPTPRETASDPPDNGAPQPKSGRKANGQFAEGNPGGAGNPYNRQVAALRKQLLSLMTPTVFQQTAQALINQACSGNVPALKLLYSYTLASYLLEGQAPLVPELLKKIGRGYAPASALQEALGLDLLVFERRLRRWLSERN